MNVSLYRLLLGSALTLVAVGSVNCSSAGGEDVGTGATSEAMSSTIHSSYGVTSFGGPGDYQTVACGGNSRTIDPWYVASSQRYGCHKHLKLTANGKCAVVATADAGPASWVESNAGVPILDASPTVGKYFFNDGGLGWSDLKAHPGKYVVHAEITTLPVGPCDGSGSSSSSGGSSSSSSSGGSSSSSSGGSSSGGTACSSDGDCNPGNDGSGQICTGGQCVDGCHTNAQCPGSTTCVGGLCR
jgi:hypothetical protein